MDVQPGGIWQSVMVRPDSEEYPGLVACDTVEEPERLTFTHGSPNEPEQFEVTVTFKDVVNGRTALAMQSTFRSAEERGAAEEFGALEAPRQTLGHLAEHLANNEVA